MSFPRIIRQQSGNDSHSGRSAKPRADTILRNETNENAECEVAMKEPWVIETACLGMRPFTENDVEELHSALDNDEFVRAAHEYFGSPEVKEELEKSLLEGGGHAPWAVVMKATGELAGFFGIAPWSKKENAVWKALYVMRSKRFEQGYASEAMQAARRFIERVFVRASAPCERASSSAPEKRPSRKPVARRRRGAARRIPGCHRGNAGGSRPGGLPCQSPCGLSRPWVDREAVPRTQRAQLHLLFILSGAAPALCGYAKDEASAPAMPANEKRPRANCARPLRGFKPVRPAFSAAVPNQ